MMGVSGRNGKGAKGERPLRILLVLRAMNMDRITEGLLRCMLDRGHKVHIAIENKKDRAGRATEESVFDVLARSYPRFSFAALSPRRETWLYPAMRLRSAIDFLQYFEPEFTGAENLRDRARRKAPWYVRFPAALQLFRLRPLRRLASGFLRMIERRMPISEESLELMREVRPDIVLVSPLVEIGSPQGDHLRAADTLGIPTGLIVASWDNLTTKGALRDAPDVTIVWNQDQVEEATRLHGLPADSVIATGAHSHDHWFDWQPSTERAEFMAKVGLEPERPFVLYVCSSGFIAGDEEAAFVREWAERIWSSGDPELETLSVLVRPHPQNYGGVWQDDAFEDSGRLVVWPRGGVAPTDSRSKDDYFDSLYHSKAVVGINTTALVDSAIVRRPVFTIVGDQFRATQTGTLHFSYLAREGGGLLNVARSWEEHFSQLGSAMRSPDGHRARIDEFLQAFIRPRGLERPAAPIALDAIEETARTDKTPAPRRRLGRSLVGSWAGALGWFHRLILRLRPETMRRRRRAREKEQRDQARLARQSAKPRKTAYDDPEAEMKAAEKAARREEKLMREAERERSEVTQRR
jgi:hypothetical protein